MRGFLSSHRRRRRLAWLTGLVVVGTAATVVGVHWSNTAPSQDTPFSSKPAQVVHVEKQVPLSKDAQAAARQTAQSFVVTAVERRHLDRSWKLIAPVLRQGYTQHEWGKGNIPVVPYLAKLQVAKWRLDYSYRNRVGLEVLLIPKPGQGARPQTFDIELLAAGSGPKRYWLVDAWTPRGVAGNVSAAPGSGSRQSLAVSRDSPLGAVWLLVPVGLFSLILLLPLGLGIRGWVRTRRADRDYSRALPPLPHQGESSSSSPS